MALPAGAGLGTIVSGTGDISVAWPTHSAGYLGTLIVQTANQTVSTPSGWTQYPNSPVGQGTPGAAGAVGLQVFYKWAASGSEPNVTITDPGDHVQAFIICNTGADTSVPYDFTAASTSSGTSLSLPSGTTASANRHVIHLIATARDAVSSTQFSGWTNAALSSLTERKDATIATGTGGGFGMVTGDKATQGSIGTTTVTQATSDNVAMMTIVLQPPAVINAAPATWSWTGVDLGFIYNKAINAAPATWSWTGAPANFDYIIPPTTIEIVSLHAEPASWNWQFYNTGPYRETRRSTQIEYRPGRVPSDPKGYERYLEFELNAIADAIARIRDEKQDV